MQYHSIIQFLGLILFVTNGGTSAIDAIVPDVPSHTAFIAFHKADYDNGKVTVAGKNIVGAFTDSSNPRIVWDYVVLDGEAIEFQIDDSTSVGPPAFLTHLNNDCCGTMGSVRNEYQRYGVSQKANIYIDQGDIGWSEQGSRLDTRLDFSSSRALVISGKKQKGGLFFIEFSDNANVVIGNYSFDWHSTLPPPTQTDPPGHFKTYYKMIGFGWSCLRDIGSGNCKPNLSPPTKKTPITAVPLYLGVAGESGAQIDCSNSQYP